VLELSKQEVLRTWLQAHELGEIHERLAANDVDLGVLAELDDSDLKDLGLSLGQRRRLVKALRDALSSTESGARDHQRPVQNRAERRQLTVMFVDLVGSTALAARLDPEEMGELIRLYQNAVAGEIARVDGHLAKFMGDGVLAYFGWPTAHEDEAERAVRAGLAIAGSVGRLQKVHGHELAARVGIATGLVVVGDLVGEGAAQEEAVVGETPNLAARLQELAQPSEVVVSDQTYRLAHAAFDFRDLGEQELKGLARPIRMFAVVGERSQTSRFEIRSGGRPGSLFGREQELALLREHWSRAEAGNGQGVLVSGDAGIGKSRLLHALVDSIKGQEHVLVRYQCSPYYRDSALWPVVQQLCHAAQIVADDADDAKLDKLERLLDVAGRSPDAARLLASLIGIPSTGRYPPITMGAQQQRMQTLLALTGQLLGLAARRPVLLIFEDAHWIDPTTLEMLQLALDRIGRARVMMLLTSRPDAEPPVAAHPRVTRLTLNRLGRAAVEAITNRVAGSRWLPPSLVDEIASRADGVPLFVEELTKAVVELADEKKTGDGFGSAAVPVTLHDSLMARLDRVPEVKRVAQLAACIGREFDFQLLSSATGLPPRDLELALERLVAAELIFRRGAPPDVTYTFKHALVRDAAANSLLLSERRRIHSAIADALASGSRAGPPELVAQHAEAAGQTGVAIRHWLLAGQGAAARYANVEAVSHFERALNLVLHDAESEDRDRRELDVLVALGVPQIAARGYASTAVEGTFSRARVLCERLGDRTRLFFVLRGLWNCVFDRADLEQSLDIANMLRELAQGGNDPEQLGLAYRAVGTTQFNRGEFNASLEAFCHAIEACGQLDNDRAVQVYGEAPAIVSLSYTGWALSIVGRLSEGLKAGEQALNLARQCGHPLLTAFISQLYCNVLIENQRPAECLALAEGALKLSREHLFVFWLAGLSVSAGRARADMGDVAAGVEQVRTGIANWKSTGAALHVPTWSLYLAKAQLLGDDLDDAEAVLAEALAVAHRNGDVVVLSELHRLSGQVHRRRGRGAVAEAALRQALEIARRQGAKLFELRAAVDLARLLADRGGRAEAKTLLGTIVPWFDRETEAADITEAMRLQATLASS
jgi:class 3 adenylate cyclase/predicted ATPase